MWPVHAIAREPWVWGPLLAGAAMAVAYVFAAERAGRASRTLKAFCFLATLLIVTVTLYPTENSGMPNTSLCVKSLLGAPDAYIPTGSEPFLNVLLFIPAGVGFSVWLRRFIATFLGLLLLSVGVELIQDYLGTHTCSGADLKENAVGAVVGIGLGIALTLLRRRLGGPKRPVPLHEEELSQS